MHLTLDHSKMEQSQRNKCWWNAARDNDHYLGKFFLSNSATAPLASGHSRTQSGLLVLSVLQHPISLSVFQIASLEGAIQAIWPQQFLSPQTNQTHDLAVFSWKQGPSASGSGRTLSWPSFKNCTLSVVVGLCSCGSFVDWSVIATYLYKTFKCPRSTGFWEHKSPRTLASGFNIPKILL